MALTTPAFVPTDAVIGMQPINETSTTRKHPLGQRVKARCPTYGPGEFIYLLGVASTAAGDVVMYHDTTWETARAAARTIGPVAVAMSANVASQYGWYCVHGTVPATAGTVSDNTAVYLTATAGSVDDAVVAGDQVLGAKFASATDTGQARVSLAYPFVGDTDNT